MLEVISLEEAKSLVAQHFSPLNLESHEVPLAQAAGRAIDCDIVAREGVPPFDRSTVDGFAVVASDTFGCSDALPALLELAGEIDMGAEPDVACARGACVRIPTGGQLPQGADAVVMLEHCEEYGDGTVGVAKPVAPGGNVVFACDDVKPGDVLIASGTTLMPHHVGTLASLGRTACPVRRETRVGIISTGDEIVSVEQTPVASQMRDVNAPMLAAAVEAYGAVVQHIPIVPDDYEALLAAVREALETCDMLLVSGGSSAGRKDNTARVLRELGAGELLFHGIAVKPGKPTLCADVQSKPAFGLPGHPVAAYFMFLELAAPLLGGTRPASTATAILAEALPSNHGRAELVAVRLETRDGGVHGHLHAVPVRGKSGLVSQLSHAHGYLEIPRNCEGLPAGAAVDVKLF